MKRAARFSARQAWLWRHRNGFGERAGGFAPRLLVDVSAIIRHDAHTGIQRVVRAVWSELRRRATDRFAIVPVFATSTQGYCYAPQDFLQGTGSYPAASPVRVVPGDKFLGLDLAAHLLPKYRRQLKSWRDHGATIHLIVYDLLPIVHPEWFTPSAVTHFRSWLQVVLRDADQAICISEHVAGELTRIARAMHIPRRPRIDRMRMGADISASVPSSGISADEKRAFEQIRFRPTILMVGTIEPRKGYARALAAFDHLWRTQPTNSPDLVIVGKAGWKTARLQENIRSHKEFGGRLKWFESMSDEGLCMLYEACQGLLMTSRGEGWGLPLIEASMQRRFVLARDLPVFREHKLPNMRYFTDDSPSALADEIQLLASLGEGPAPIPCLPTWSECVEELLATLGIGAPSARIVAAPLRKAS